MGVVYRAHDTLLERVVALKIIGTTIDDNPQLRERFFREARAAGQLSHRNVITIHDLGEHEGRPYLAMEFLTGEDLQRRLSRPEPMSLARKLEIAAEVCDGLSYAHRHGVIHRDIKPANIFITDDGLVKILDFGLARMVTSELTGSNMMLGTLNYMAPEQVRGERLDHRADIFSFGVVLYELLSGRKAFQGDSFATTLYKILQDVPEPLLNIDSTLPYEIVRLVEKSLAKARDERYQDLTDLARDLAIYRQHFSHAESVTMAAPAGSHRVPSDAPRPAGTPRPDSGQRPKSAPPSDPSAPTMLAEITDDLLAGGAPPDATARTSHRRAWIVAAVTALIAATTAAVWFATHEPAAPEHTAVIPPAAPAGTPQIPPPVSTPSKPDDRPATTSQAPVQAPPTPAPPAPSDRGADEAYARMTRAKTAARQAGAAAIGSAAFAAATAAEREGVRLRRAGRQQDAAAKFYEASGLFRSAELTPPPAAPPTPRPETTSPVPAPPPTTTTPASPTPAAPVTEPPVQPAPAPPQPVAPPPAPVTKPPASTSPAPPAENTASAEQGVRDLIKRYEQAMEARSIDALKRLWPSLQGAQEDAIRKDFMHARRIDVDITNEDIAIAGTTATVTFLRRYQVSTVDGQRLLSNSRTTLSARRAGDDWIIERVRFEVVR